MRDWSKVPHCRESKVEVEEGLGIRKKKSYRRGMILCMTMVVMVEMKCICPKI